MERFGKTLERARASRGRTLESIAEETRIARRYLEALEASDFDALPGGAFDTGYIRSYAEALGLDPEPFLAGYRAERERTGRGKEETEAQYLEKLSQVVRKHEGRSLDPRDIRRALVAGLGLVLLLGLAWMVAAPERPTRSGGEDRPAPAARAPVDSSAPSARSAPAAGAGPPKEVPEAERPAPAATATAATADPSSAAEIAVTEAAVGRDIVARNLVGAAERFAEGSTVVFWTRVVGARNGSVIRHVWRYGGRVVMRSDLTIGGPHWRTYSRLVLPEGSSGAWEVEARDPAGKVLARERFVCDAQARDAT